MIVAIRLRGRADERQIYYRDRRYITAWAGSTADWMQESYLDVDQRATFFEFAYSSAPDRKAILPVLSQINVYPLSQFDGKMKIKNWTELPHYPAQKPTGGAEIQWVNPDTYFDELPALMKAVPPLPGEESLYEWISSVLEAADKDPTVKQTLKETAVASEKEMLPTLLQWRHNGRSAGNGWNTPVNSAEWGTDYLNRTATARSNIYENRPRETKYIYTDNDNQGQQLDGHNTYTITFPRGKRHRARGSGRLPCITRRG